MSLWGWLGRRIKLTDGQFWAQYFGGDSWTGEAMSPTIAMQNSAFWSGVRLTSQTIGSLGMGLYRKEPGGRIEIIDGDLVRILTISPDGVHSAQEYWEGAALCLFLTGNFYAYKVPGVRGTIIGLQALNPNNMTVKRLNPTSQDATDLGQLVYDYVGTTGKFRRFSPDEIFHVRGFGIGGDTGLSPVQYGAQTLGVARAAEKAAGKTFANGMRSSGWLVSKNTLTKDQRELAKQNLIEPMTGADNAGRIGLLEGEFFDFKQVSILPEDAELLKTRAWGVEEVCRIIGIPPILVGHASSGQTMWGTGIGQIISGWYTLGLRPILRRIEKSIGLQLIPLIDRGQVYAEFTVEELLRADPSARGEFYWKLMQVGAITPNQICDAENYPRFNGGNKHYVNQTLAVLDEQGTPVKQNPITNANPLSESNRGQPGNTPPPNQQNSASDDIEQLPMIQSVGALQSLLRVVK